MNSETVFKLLTKESLADLFNKSVRTIENWVNAGILLYPGRLGEAVYWNPETFFPWLRERLSTPSAMAVAVRAGAADIGPFRLESNTNSDIAFKPLTKESIAGRLNKSVRTIENWVNAGILPQPGRLGKAVYWNPETFFPWLREHLATPSVIAVAVLDGAAEPQLVGAEPEALCQPAPSAITGAAQDCALELQPARAKPNARGRSATMKTELNKIHNRTQAQLDALMG